MKPGEKCDFCCPTSQHITNVPLTLEELTDVRRGIEALGGAMKCGDARLVCLPLLRVQKELDRIGKDTMGK